MLLAWWTIGSALLSAFYPLGVFFPRLTLTERACASGPAGIALVSWTTLLASHISGELSESSLLWANLAVCLGLRALASTRQQSPQQKPAAPVWPLPLSGPTRSLSAAARVSRGVVLCVGLTVCYIMKTHLLDPVEGEWWTSGNCYSDLPFHMSVMNSFLYGKNSRGFSLFKMSEVIYDGHRLVYPIVPDYFSAMLVRGGFSQRWALLIPSWIHALAFFFMLHAASLRFLHPDSSSSSPSSSSSSSSSSPSSTKTTSLLRLPRPPLSHSSEAAREIAAALVVLLTVFCGGNYEFKEPPFWLFFIKDIFLPQRSAMFAYTLSLASVVAMWIGLEETNQAARLQYLQLSGLLCGLLPYLQGHAFICMFMVQPVTLLLDFALLRLTRTAKDNIWSLTLVFVLEGLAWAFPALLLGLPQMVSFMVGASRWGFAVYEPMWIHGGNQDAFSWLWTCLGLFLYVSAAGLLLQTPRQWVRSVGFWVLFIVSCFFKFQPWEVDNMKLLYIAYFGMAMLVALVFDWIRAYGKVAAVLGGILMLTFMIPGIVCVVKKEIGEQYALYSANDIVIGEWVRDNTGPESVFLIGSRHNHPVLCIGGKSVYYGYKGWLVSRGYNWGEREQVARQVYSGKENALELLRNHGIDYIVIGHGVTRMEGVEINRQWFRNNLNKVFSTDDFAIWEVKEKGRPYKKQMFGSLYHNEEDKRDPDPNRH